MSESGESAGLVESQSNLKFYLVVNSDLNLSVGQMAAQISHITQEIVDEIVREIYTSSNTPDYCFDYEDWLKHPITIIKKAPEDELRILSMCDDVRVYHDDIYNKSLKIKENRMTVIGFFPRYTEIEALRGISLL